MAKVKVKNVRIKAGDNTYIGITAPLGEEGKRVPFLSIKDSTTFLDFNHTQYTRRLLKEGKFDKPLEPLEVDQGKYVQWFIAIPSLAAYRDSRVERSSKRRFTLWMDLEERERVEEAIKALGVDYKLELSYKPGDSKKKSSKKDTPKKEEEPLEEFIFSEE